MKWALLFGVTMLACAGLCVIAPFCGWWLPEGVSSHAASVDFLFYIILGITTFFFVLTEALLVLFMARYASEPGKKPVKDELPGFLKPITGLLDNQHKVEMAWTVVPAAILLYIAFAQVKTWADIKYLTRQESISNAMQVDVSARQFEWRMRYPSVERFKEWQDKKDEPKVKDDMKSFARVVQKDDIHIVNELHVWKDHHIVVHLSTRDVLHSFNLPHMRVKQDALPGKQIQVWFKPIKANQDSDNEQIPDHIWDLPCAELCGWGHGRMIGRLYVHETRDDFVKWLVQAEKTQVTVPMKSASK